MRTTGSLARIREAIVVVAVLGCGLGPGCGGASSLDQRREAIVATLASHLAHEDEILSILERHRSRPQHAATLIDRYLAEHGAAIRALCEQRRQLEDDPQALAAAMRELEPRLSRIFARREALSRDAPELMAREEVRTALAALEPL